ncbi:MAG: hypothetical protein LUH04_01380 [Clostridium sp.]|nr:hypothetical protein [Clostridium sp.]
MAVIAWMTVFLALLGLEIAQRSLMTLWFAGGAFAAAAAAWLCAGTRAQLMCFVVVSFLLLIAVRPAAVLARRAADGRRHREGRMHGATTGFE